MQFKLISDYKPTGDQPEAIRQLVEGLNRGEKYQTLLGVTGSGKTFTIANVVEQINRPTLIMSHNKTLAAQLYGEFKQFFPNNLVEYFVSYYDYYQPEAFIPSTGTYIEKDLSINDEIEKLRLSTTSSLLSGRRDVLVVSSVSCIYGVGNPEDFKSNTVWIKTGEKLSRNHLLHRLVDALYNRTTDIFSRGTFRVNGDTVDVLTAQSEHAYRIIFWGDEIEELQLVEVSSGKRISNMDSLVIFPANIFVTTKEGQRDAIMQIQDDLHQQLEFFKGQGKMEEAKRLEDRVLHDIEMIKELGYCSGIENYSRYFDRRAPGTRPFCLLDYFPSDFLTVIDESHVTVSQVNGMYGGDRSRKITLVDYGFRLPSAMDNRPLKFDEFEALQHQVIYVSATPAEYELRQSGGVVVEQVIRPTRLLDPIIEIRPVVNQVDDLLDEIEKTVQKGERILVTTLTKRMAEELSKYMLKLGVNCKYIHSDVDTLERVEILRNLRLGNFDVLIGINLLREGLDLPEVSLVAILDADKEGFLRSERSLTQTAGRAARNLNGKVIMYADKVTGSMQKTIDETQRRREKQIAYNQQHGLVPTALHKSKEDILKQTSVVISKAKSSLSYTESEPQTNLAADPVVAYMTDEQLRNAMGNSKKLMEKAAKELDFIEAARHRDEMFAFKNRLEELSNKDKR